LILIKFDTCIKAANIQSKTDDAYFKRKDYGKEDQEVGGADRPSPQ